MRKRVLAIVLSLLMIFSVCPMSVFASDDAADPQIAEEATVQYSYDELLQMNDQYGYGLTQDQIKSIAAGQMTLEEALAANEVPVTMIVQLSSEGVISQDEETFDEEGNLTDAALAAKEEMENDQQAVQNAIEDTVLDGEKLDVLYSYTLLTNSFAIQAKASQLQQIAQLDGVESVYTAPIYEPVPTDASSVTTDDQKAENYFTNSTNTTSNKGTGTVIAIIDTGLDSTYTYNSTSNKASTTFHKAFRTPVTNPTLSETDILARFKSSNAYSRISKLEVVARQGYTNSIYRSTKVPYGFNYADDSVFVGHKYNSSLPSSWSSSWAWSYWYDDEQGDHGTHVSGITAGYETDAEGKVVFEGVAPDAQLLVMKVFGKTRAGNFADILAAMEDAVLFGADVINLSLGTWAGFTYGGDRPDYDAAFKAAANAGIVVCASAGNDYTAAKGTKYGNDLALASNPDNGIIGSPASYDDNLAVASMASNSYYAKSVIVDGRAIAYTNNATEAVRSIEKFSGTTKNYAILKDANGKMLTGKPGDWEAFASSCKVKDKFAVIRRGETFTKSVALAEEYGAIGLIVCDHSDGALVNMMENADVNIPAIFISKSDGDYLFGLESDASATHTMEITNTTSYVNNPVAGQMSDFSSWGVTPDLKLKPEITGYGGNVYSTLQDSKYGLMSGTSMSSPYLAGVSALMVQSLNSANPTADDNSFLNFEAAYVNQFASRYIGTVGFGTVSLEEKVKELEAAIELLPDESKTGRDLRIAPALAKLADYYNSFTTSNAQAKLNAIGSATNATGGYPGYMDRMHAARIALESMSTADQNKVSSSYRNKLRNAQRTLLNSYLMAQIKTVVLNDAAYKEKVDATRFWYDRWLANPYSTISATNLKRLFNAESQLTVSLINNIGTVELTLACKEKIDEARRYYDNLMNTADANAAAYKTKITNYATLTAAEEAYANLLQQAATVANVNARASDVTAPTDFDAYKEAVTYTRTLYNALSDEDKAQITNYAPAVPAISGSAKQILAKALMMSTATPVLFDSDAGIPCSPRQQGAGLVNIDAALTSKAYVTVDGSPTPKIDLGDDKAKTGEYTLTFDVVNIGSDALTFDVSANVQTEKVEIQDVSYQTRRIDPEKAAAFRETGLEFREQSYSHRVYAIDELKDVKFMSGEPYDLTAMSTVTGTNTVTVPAGETATVTLTVTLGAEAKAYMDENFVNGIYVEGFITLTSRTAGQPNLSIPYMGFYGDWTQAPMLDEGTWEDNFLGNPVHPQMDVSTGCNIYWGDMVGNFNYPLGLPNSSGKFNPYDLYAADKTYLKDVRNVFGGELQLNANAIAAELALLRSARTIKYTVSDAQTGEIYSSGTKEYQRKSYYYGDSVGMVNCGYFYSDLFTFDGKIDGTQTYIEPGTKVKYDVEVIPDYGSEADVNNLNNTMSFYAYYDGATPDIDLVEPYLNEETGDVMLHYKASDDTFVGEVSVAICGYVAGGAEETVYLHTMFLPDQAGDSVEETLNLSEWARSEGLLQMRSVRLTVEDFCQKNGLNPNPVLSDSYKNEYWITFFDKIKVSCITDILPVGSEAQLNVDYTYGEKLLGGTWIDAEGDANNNDYGLEEDFIYLSSDPSVLRITADGKLIPVSAGYADVTATGRYGKASGSMRLRVIEDPVQLQITAAEAGETVTLTEDTVDSSLLINKDTVIDLNGHTIHGIDGYPAIRVIGGNVTIKNGAVDAKFGDNSRNPLLTDILEDNAAAIRVEGGNVTLDGLTVTGATFDQNGETVLGGSAVVQTGGNLTVRSSNLSGLYAVNNSSASGTAALVSGNFEGILGAVADMTKVVKSEGSEFIDMTNTLSDDSFSYLGTIEGGSAGYYLPQNCLYYSAEDLYNAEFTGSSKTYNAEKGCVEIEFTDSTSYFALPANINASDYTFAAFISNGAPSNFTYHKPSFSSSTTPKNNYLSGETNLAYRDVTAPYVYVKSLAPCENFTGYTETLYFWPAYQTYGRTGTMEIYGLALFNNKADAMSFAVGKANAYTNNLKVAAPQTFNTQLIIDGTTLNVSTSFPDDSDGGYKWTANELSLYTRTTNSDNTYSDTLVETKPISPDENGDVDVSFEGIDPANAYVVKVNFALSLTADSKASYFSLSESSAAALVKAFPDLLDEMLGVDALEASVTDLLDFFLYGMREGFVERDARHYDCPLGPAYINNYPYIDDYPDIIGRNSNNDYATWTAYWDNRTFSEFIGVDKVNYDETVTRISYAILFASILGDAKMTELMANLQNTVPARTWDMLNEEMRAGHFGLTGSVPTYHAQLAALKASATGATAREQLVNGLTYLSNNFINLYASILAVINSTYTEGVEFKSYSDPTSNDSLLNVLNGKNITDTYNFGAYNDRHDEMVEKVEAVREAVAYTQNAKNGLMSAMNAALYGTLASYQTEAADLLNLYFDDNAIPGGTIDLGITAQYESEANYDGYITYELNGGVNNDANPIGYQRLLPVTLAEPTKDGYVFGGWYTTADFAEGTEFTATTGETTGDLVLYAKWTINSYTMTFMDGDTVVDTLNFSYGDATRATDALTITEGLVFAYWYENDPETAYNFTTMPSHDVTLHAQFGYMSIDNFDTVDGVYVWPKESGASLHLTVDKDCTIDFGGKVVSNMDDLAIITVENGATVTIRNAIFQPNAIQNAGGDTYTLYVTGGSNLTLKDCVVRGAKAQDGDYYATSAVRVDNGTVAMDNCVVTGLYAVNNTKGSGSIASPSVSYTTGIYTGLVVPFSVAEKATCSGAAAVDVSTLVNDENAAADLASKAIIAAPVFTATTFGYTYLPDTDEVEINATESDAKALPDGSTFVYLPKTANVDDGEFQALTDGSVKIGDFNVGIRNMKVTYSVYVKLSDTAAADLYNTDDSIAAASTAEISAFNALLPEYNRVIRLWNNNKDKIISKFSQYADNAMLAPYLKDIRACIDNINGAGDKEGILPQLESKIDYYESLTTDAEKLAWLLANKDSVIQLTVNLQENTNQITTDCMYLNALAVTFMGTDYSDKLEQIFEMNNEITELRAAAEKQPSIMAADYAAAEDKTAFVDDLLNGTEAYSGNITVDGEIDIGTVCAVTARISKTDPIFDIPSYTVLTGTTLSDIELPDARYQWVDGSVKLSSTGNYTYAAVFTHENTEKYNPVTFDIAVEVITPATYCERNGHSYVETVISPTCTEDGLVKQTCSVCGDVVILETLKATGHVDENQDDICDVCGEELPVTFANFFSRLFKWFKNLFRFLRILIEFVKRIHTFA